MIFYERSAEYFILFIYFLFIYFFVYVLRDR